MNPDHQPDQQTIIRSVIERYFNAVDRADFELLAACFAEQAKMTFNLDQQLVFTGRDKLIDGMRGMLGRAASIHALASTSILVNGGEAAATTFATAHVVLGPINAGRVLVRGLRYDDRFVVENGQWRIAERHHNPLWQYESVSVKPGV